MLKNIRVGFGLPAVIIVASANGQTVLGPEWIEQGDAGSLPGSAQTAVGEGQLTKIRGQLQGLPVTGAGDFEDMYRIRIVTPTQFTMTTDSPLAGGGGSANFDTQMWVFDVEGNGLLGNDDINADNNRSFLSYFATDNSGSVILEPGEYFVCISGQGNRPTSTVIGEGTPVLQIFQFDSPFEVSGPDGPGGDFPVDSWAASGAIGTYEIALTGSGFIIPAPAYGLIVAFPLLMQRRRARLPAA